MSARTPSPPKKPRSWLAYKIAGRKAAMLGHVAATNMDEAVAAAAAEYRVPAGRILVQPTNRTA
jgi:hypothetical protein